VRLPSKQDSVTLDKEATSAADRDGQVGRLIKDPGEIKRAVPAVIVPSNPARERVNVAPELALLVCARMRVLDLLLATISELGMILDYE
jgi:hypothetical protein